MKIVILAGGMGTRLAEYTKAIPKPMVRINNKPIIYFILKHFANFGFKDFIIATGYKGQVIKNYFSKKKFGWNIKIINTGLKTMTGGRLLRLKKYLNDEDFFLTYGDGISNVDLKKLVKFHQKNKKLVTLTAVRPPARFGTIKLNRNKVSYFREKSSLDEGWINGGFFVINSKFLRFIKNDNTFLEREPFELLTRKNQLAGYRHKGFWQCMDTLRDKEILEKKIKQKNFE